MHNGNICGPVTGNSLSNGKQVHKEIGAQLVYLYVVILIDDAVLKCIVAALFVSLLERLRASLEGQVLCFSNTFSVNMIH